MITLIGKLLGNRYEVLEQLGGGGMAIVYKAKDTFLNRMVTIKALRPEYLSDSDFIRRFRREAQAVASLSHPNIVNIHDVGQEDETHYLVMEYIDGDNLKNFIRDNSNLPLEKIVNIVRQICDALQHAHENNIVHRDVKPHNILITHSQRVKLTDFGIALEATTGTVTNTETIMGSVHYISPEQAKGETPGPRSDIYSLGVVLYEMLTGRLPFQGDGPVAVALKHVQDSPPLPTGINPQISPDLERVVMKAMEKNPELRYQSAQQFSIDLKLAISGLGVDIDSDDDFATQVLPANIKSDAVEEKPKEKQKPKAVKFGIMAALLLFSLLAGVLLALFNYLNVPEVTVPAVEGMVVEEAIATLALEGLDHTVREINHPEVELGFVISQSIPPDTTVKRGRTIELTVSLGPELQNLPDVRNQTVGDARITLNNAGFDSEVREVFDNREVGIVVDQDPPPGNHPKGITVILQVSKGPEPVLQRIPDLVGLFLDEARARLAAHNLILDEPATTSQRSDRYLENQVIQQNPQAGTELREGSGVAVVLSAGPGPTRRSADVRVEIDDDGQNHELRIRVIDVRGERDAYVATHAPGEVVVRTVDFFGSATIRVYVDGVLRSERSL